MIADPVAAARVLFDEHEAGAPYTGLPEGLAPVDAAEGYAVQDELCRMLVDAGAGEVAGYKVALSSRAMQEMTGVDAPCVGTLLAGGLHDSPATVAASSFGRLGVECELAVRLGADVEGPAGSHTVSSVTPAIAACMASFELVDDRNADYGAIHGPTLVADNCWNAGVVLGDAGADWAALDIPSLGASLSVNGEVLDTATAGAAGGHPFEVVAFMANVLAERGIALRAGMVLITGSVVKTHFPSVGDEIVFTLDDLGEVRLRVD